MKPAWDQLDTAFKGSPNVLILDVDCTSDAGKAVCEAVEVKGYPTIKYFNETTGASGEKYEGGRDFKALKKFVKKTLKGQVRVCEPKTKKDCFPEETAYLEKWESKSPAEISVEAARVGKKFEEVLKSDQRKQFEFEYKLLALLGKSAEGKKEL